MLASYTHDMSSILLFPRSALFETATSLVVSARRIEWFARATSASIKELPFVNVLERLRQLKCSVINGNWLRSFNFSSSVSSFLCFLGRSHEILRKISSSRNGWPNDARFSETTRDQEEIGTLIAAFPVKIADEDNSRNNGPSFRGTFPAPESQTMRFR